MAWTRCCPRITRRAAGTRKASCWKRHAPGSACEATRAGVMPMRAAPAAEGEIPMKHLIIGNGPTGVIAAETIARNAPQDQVVLLGDEPEPCYSRMAIP